jgi:4-hydroxy-tetrahydrodipicolinate synthase
MFVGAMTALVTPFNQGRVDKKALEELVEAQIAGGIDALVPCGTTGESATLSHEEHHEVIRLVVQAAQKRIPVIAGAGSNSTAEAIALSKAAQKAGADGLLHITPYYNKPTQEGLYLHFKAVVEAAALPTILYNVPGRTSCDLAVDTLARLCAELPAIVGIKEATGSVVRAQQIVQRLGDRVALLSGEDAIHYPLYCVGARGCISVVGNVAPKLVSECWDATQAGDHPRAQKLHYQSLPLADLLFVETNPIPVKAAVALLMKGRMSPEIRLPLHPMSAAPREKLRALLGEMGLLS